MNPSYILMGAVILRADGEQISALLDLCLRRGISYADLISTAEGYSITLRYSAYSKLKKAAAKEGIELCVSSRHGLPALLERYKFRFGIPVGVMLAAIIVILSHLFVWDIDVTGNETITAAEVRELLKDEGFKVGSYIPLANTDRIENKIMMKTDGISWMSINIIGTVAEVQIREYAPPSSEIESGSPAHLVASKSGTVEEVRIIRGEAVVSTGLYVEKGDVLVSGIIESERHGLRYERAQGEVFARTKSEFVIEIPFEYEAKSYTGEEFYEKYLNFFDFSINILKNSGNEGVFYDKISIVENFCFPDGKETPFGVRTDKYRAYETVTLTRTPEEAEELAYFALAERLASLAEDSTVTRKRVTPIVGKDSFMLICSVELIENIAETREFEPDIFGGQIRREQE
jgi:similar to stage IV sporulation protein